MTKQEKQIEKLKAKIAKLQKELSELEQVQVRGGCPPGYYKDPETGDCILDT